MMIQSLPNESLGIDDCFAGCADSVRLSQDVVGASWAKTLKSLGMSQEGQLRRGEIT